MPKQKTTLVYQFDELDEKAKERARDWYREGNCEDNYWSELTKERTLDHARMYHRRSYVRL